MRCEGRWNGFADPTGEGQRCHRRQGHEGSCGLLSGWVWVENRDEYVDRNRPVMGCEEQREQPVAKANRLRLDIVTNVNAVIDDEAKTALDNALAEWAAEIFGGNAVEVCIDIRTLVSAEDLDELGFVRKVDV